jgi:hypothetical protein
MNKAANDIQVDKHKALLAAAFVFSMSLLIASPLLLIGFGVERPSGWTISLDKSYGMSVENFSLMFGSIVCLPASLGAYVLYKLAQGKIPGKK